MSCNLSYDIEEKALVLGQEIGTEKTNIHNIKNIMDSLKMTAKQAMDALKIPEDEQPKYLSKI